MSEEIFSLIQGDCSAKELEAYLAQLPLDVDSLHILLNRRNKDKYTPLHCALFARNLDAMKILIKHRADIDLKCHGTPCLHLALTIATLPGARNFGIEAFNLLVKHDADCTAKDDQLATILHLAAEFDFADVLSNLLKNPALAMDLESKDRGGNRPLHRAVWRDSAESAKVLVEGGALVDAQTQSGSSPLHLCASNAAVKTWEVLTSAGAREDGKQDSWGRTPAEVAELHGWKVSGKGLKPDMHKLHPSNLLSTPTTVITHKYCRQHYTCPPSETGDVPPENAKRLHVLVDQQDGVLKGSDLESRLVWNEDCRMASMSDVLRVHEWSYIRRIQGHCEQIRSDANGYGGISNLDGDTTLSRLTFEAALRGAGAVCEGVDEVLSGRARNAFAPVRPPGHHAGPRGLTKGEEGGPDSHGFCFLNNLSIGAAYAMNRHRDTIKRVALVDFDVHHGNGTEETVRWLKPGLDQEEYFGDSTFGTMHIPRYKPWYGEDDAQNVMFVSIHGYGPRERGLESLFPQGAFYPGSGKTKIPDRQRLLPKNQKNSTIDAGSSSSTKGVGTMQTIDINTLKAESQQRAGSKSMAGVAMDVNKHGTDDDEEDEDNEDEEDNDDDEDDDDDDYDEEAELEDEDSEVPNPEHKYTSRKLRAMRKLYTNMDAYVDSKKDRDALILDVGCSLPEHPEVTSSEYRHIWRNYFRQEIFPGLMAFKPDLIFISAGFDGHKKDTINSGYIALVEEDFDWVTQGLIRVANSCCNGRIVSALEGGYQLGGECCSSFAKSVKTHVAALVAGARTVAPWSAEDAQVEQDLEKVHLDEAAERRAQKEALRQAQLQSEQEAAAAAAAEAATLAGYEENSRDSNSRTAWEHIAHGEGASLNAAVPVFTEDANGIHVASRGEADEDGSARKRRRRPAVDYVALDIAMQAQKESTAQV